MSKSFVFNDFIRHLDPPLLEAYLARYAIHFPSQPPITSQQLIEFVSPVFQTLFPELVSTIETDLRQINELTTYAAQTILLDLAKMRQVQLPDQVTQMTQYDMALWFFLNQPTIFAQAIRIYELEDLAGWREFLSPQKTSRHLRDRTKAIQTALQTHLLKSERRGANCIIEHYRKGNSLFYIAYAEDFARVKVTYTGSQQLNRQICKPVQRIYFRYDMATGLLSIKGFRGRRQLEAYRNIFCQAVLKQQATRPKVYVCNLRLLAAPEFQLTCGPDVDRVVITSVTVTLANRSRTVTLDFTTEAPTTITELHRQLGQYNLSVDLVTFLRVKFCFKFKLTAISQGRNSVTCYLAHPDAHNLADTPLHHQVMAYFKQWGLYCLASDETSTQPPQP